MAATTLTAETAAGDLLAELRELLQRHDSASTLDEARELANDISTALRRVRGRINHLARKAAAAARPPAPAPKAKTEPARPATAATPTTPAADTPAAPRTPAPGIAGRAVAAAASAVRLVRRAVGTAVRRARVLLTRRRVDIEAPAAEFYPREREVVDEREPAVRQVPRPRVEEDLAAIPDLNAEQAAGLACIECGIDFWTTHTLKVPAGVSESTGEPVWACVGACARQAGHREPVGEQLALGEAS